LVTVLLTCTKEELSGSAADEMQFYLAGEGSFSKIFPGGKSG
jgi:hypothetical protein